MSRPPLSTLTGYTRKSPGAPKGCLGGLVTGVLAIYLWSFGWNRAVRGAERSRRFNEKIQQEMLRARKRSGPVVCDVLTANPRAVPAESDMRLWLDRALGTSAPAHLAENVGVCWSNRHVFETLYRFPVESVFRAIPALGCDAESPFQVVRPGSRFIVYSNLGCSGLTDRAITIRDIAKLVGDWLPEDRTWCLVCEQVCVYPGAVEPKALWIKPDSKAWRGVREGGYFVLHDLRFSLTIDRNSADALLGTWGRLADAVAFAEEFSRCTGIATCVAKESRE